MNEEHINQLLELLVIRDRKIELQAKEIALLKKLLALKYQPKSCLHSLYPELPVDRATLETDEFDYPMMEKKDA